MDCPECGTVGIRYNELQMRGADEGSTILYNCECGHKYVLANYEPLAFQLLTFTTGGV